MMERATAIKAEITAFFVALSMLFDWFGWLVLFWVFCLALDFATGSFAAKKEGNWKSQLARDGIWSKAGSFVVVLVALTLDGTLGRIVNHFGGLPFIYTTLISPIVIVWYVLAEMGSILENCERLGFKLPSFLQRIIVVLRNQTEQAGDKAVGGTAEEKDNEQQGSSK